MKPSPRSVGSAHQSSAQGRWIAGALAAFTLAGCDPHRAVKADPTAGKTVLPARKVEVVRPARQPIRRVVEQPGQIEAAEIAPLHAKLSGYARDIAVDIGDRVKKGQALTTLSVPELEADVTEKRALIDQAAARRGQAEAAVRVALASAASAEAKLAGARTETRGAEADAARWRSEFARTQQLASERAVTSSVLDEARSKLSASESALETVRAGVTSAEATLAESKALVEKARADVAAGRAGVEVARAEAKHAEVMLGYATIEAPFDGVITRRNVDTGHLTVTGPQGDPLFVVARTDVVTVVVGVPEVVAPAVKLGAAATVRVQVLADRKVDAKVSRTSYVLDEATRTLRAEIDVPNPDGTLRPGLYAYVTIVVEDHPDALTVPVSALFREGVQTYCVKVVDGRAARQAVGVGISDGTRTEIRSGLNGDESIVRSGAASLAERQPVEGMPSEPAPGEKKP